jgi:hypothetical protein
MSELTTPVTPEDPAPVTAPHDESPPQNLLDFMVTQWKPRGPVPPAIDGAERFAARREILSGHFKGQALVIPTGHRFLLPHGQSRSGLRARVRATR